MATRSKELAYTAKKSKAPIKLPGGKSYLCRPILELVPSNTTSFVDLYGGSGVVTLNAPTRFQRVYNEADPLKYNVMRCMQDKDLFFMLRMLLAQQEYSEGTFSRWKGVESDEPAVQAAKEIVLRRMSRGGTKKDFAWSDRLRGGQPGDKNAWDNFRKEMLNIHDSWQGVEILNMMALSAAARFVRDKHATLYLDPPYVHTTRVTVDLYDEWEMTIEQHHEMANMANDADCRVIISGYRCDEYDTWFAGWHRRDIDIANHQSQAKEKKRKIECLWFNF